MGKWSLEYYDDVLSAKIKGMVDGAILRSKLEKTEPIINYEAFVEDLDAGDSFTTSMIDILVKELAERRTRPNVADRQLIADRSAKSLRMLATPLRIYRGRSGGHSAPARRTVNLTDYLTAPPDEMDMEEDDDEFESVLGSVASATEGARINSEVYDTFGGQSHRWTHPAPARRPQGNAVNSAGSEEVRDPPTPPLHSPPIPSRSGPWTLPPSSLSRQPSIRRPVRSRMVDFNDFTSRRRSTIRQSSAHESRPDASAEDAGRSWSPWDPPPQDEGSGPTRAPQLARRFFGLSRNRRHEPSGSLQWNENVTESSSTDPYWGAADPNIYQPWFSIPTPSSSSSSQSEVENAEERAQGTPRLRRGGVRAPESMLSRHASPNPAGSDANPFGVVRLPASPVSENGDGDGDADGDGPIPTTSSEIPDSRQ